MRAPLLSMSFSPAAQLQHCLRQRGEPVTRKNSGTSKRPVSSAPSCFNLIFPRRVRQTSLRQGYGWQASLRPVVAAVTAALWNASDTPTTARNVAQDACAWLFSIGRWRSGLAILAFRLFLREPIQIFRVAGCDLTI